MYKIRNKDTGLFSSGGSVPRWTNRGKIWSSLAHVKAHLRSHTMPYGARKDYLNGSAEIVVYVPVESDPVEITEELIRGKG